MGNIIQQTWEKAISKQRAVELPGGGRGGAGDMGGFRPTIPPSRGIVPRPDSGRKRGGLLPNIPFWFWLLFLLILLPLLCCCCCLCYCCFCRKGSSTSSNTRRQRPTDIETGGRVPISDGGGRFAGGRGGGGFNNLLGSLGGVGLGHLAGRLLSGGGKRHNIPSPGYQGGGAYPAAPYQPSGNYGGGTGAGAKGLYPSVAVADHGGGGGW